PDLSRLAAPMQREDGDVQPVLQPRRGLGKADAVIVHVDRLFQHLPLGRVFSHELAGIVDYIDHGVTTPLRESAYYVRIIIQKRHLGVLQIVLDELDRRRAAYLHERYVWFVEILPACKGLPFKGQNTERLSMHGHAEVDYLGALGITGHTSQHHIDLA